MTEGVGINQGENPRVEQPPRVFPEVELNTRGQVNPIGRSEPSFTIQIQMYSKSALGFAVTRSITKLL